MIFNNLKLEGNNFTISGEFFKFGYFGSDKKINLEVQQDEINRQMQEQFDREFIDFSNKSVTSFDDGGFVQGPGFNLSDTMMSNMNNGF